MIEFRPFVKISRLNREIIITEKIDGTNACIAIMEDGEFLTASRTRWITPKDDNHGFSKWAHDNKNELLKLGKGVHFGEWWGYSINRGYEIKEKRFSLFNTNRWTNETKPNCCRIVPILYKGNFCTLKINETLKQLEEKGSIVSPGFMLPEGIVIHHTHSNTLFKVTIKDDEKRKNEK